MSLKKRITALEQRLGILSSGLLLPIITVVFVEPLFDAEGRHIYGGQTCDSRQASVNGELYDRLQNESIEDFRRRLEKIPAGKFSKVTVMFPVEDLLAGRIEEPQAANEYRVFQQSAKSDLRS